MMEDINLFIAKENCKKEKEEKMARLLIAIIPKSHHRRTVGVTYNEERNKNNI